MIASELRTIAKQAIETAKTAKLDKLIGEINTYIKGRAECGGLSTDYAIPMELQKAVSENLSGRGFKVTCELGKKVRISWEN